MAQYQHLPIYKATYDLLARVTQVTAGFSKAYKYSLGDRLRLKLHPNKTSINKIEHGFDALGYVIRPHCRYLRRSTVRNGLNKLAGLCRADSDLESVRQAAHSYFGIFGHANTWKLQGQLAASLHRAGYADAVPHKINNATFPL